MIARLLPLGYQVLTKVKNTRRKTPPGANYQISSHDYQTIKIISVASQIPHTKF
jgi:hypothetical protein